MHEVVCFASWNALEAAMANTYKPHTVTIFEVFNYEVPRKPNAIIGAKVDTV
jgi:hypothetical protein